MQEGTWERAKVDADAIFRSTAFYVAEGIVGVIAAGIGVLLTADADSTQTQVVVPILAGIIGVLLPLALVLAAQLGAAPRRQRNELRDAWPTGPVTNRVNVRVSLLNYARRGDDQVKHLINVLGTTTADRRAAAVWTEEVVQFLSEHLPEETPDFIAAGEEERDLSARLGGRVVKLREIAEAISE